MAPPPAGKIHSADLSAADAAIRRMAENVAANPAVLETIKRMAARPDRPSPDEKQVIQDDLLRAILGDPATVDSLIDISSTMLGRRRPASHGPKGYRGRRPRAK